MRYLAVFLAIPPAFSALDPFGSHSSDFEVALKSAIAALTSAIIFLFFWFRASYSRIERKLDERDRQRDKLHRKIAKLEGATRMLANCPASNCPYEAVNFDDATDELGD